MIAELIDRQFHKKVNKAFNNWLNSAKLKGGTEELNECFDSDKREYLPEGSSGLLATMDFISRGYNVCILGESDVGKAYLAKAIGNKAYNRFNVSCFHSEELLESMAALKGGGYDKYVHKSTIVYSQRDLENYFAPQGSRSKTYLWPVGYAECN